MSEVLCECGCGEPTENVKWTNRRRGHVKGQPLRFISGHHLRVMKPGPEAYAKVAAALRGRPKSEAHRAKLRGANHHSWRGGRYVDAEGYVRILRPDSPMAYADGYALEHRIVIAESIGRPLLPTEIVHHVNEVKSDNRLENLRLFENVAAHMAFHRRSA